MQNLNLGVYTKYSKDSFESEIELMLNQEAAIERTIDKDFGVIIITTPVFHFY
jgi:hypothetical protein